MFDILTLNKISKTGLNELNENYSVSDSCESPDAILVRSANMHEYAFSDKTLAVARAGAGVNNIPIEKCTEKGIAVFNIYLIVSINKFHNKFINIWLN